jgi:predicted dehydrogenase
MLDKGYLEMDLMRKISRRQFLKHGVGFTGTLVAVPYVIPSSAMSKNDSLLPSERITLGVIATGDRWHAVMSILAARIGKDIYCEKPYCLTITEGRKLVETTRRYRTIWQCGTQRRSNRSYAFVIDAVRNGVIGMLHTITTSFGGWSGNGFAKPEAIPTGFDYDRWLGQAPWAPYSPLRVSLW